MTVQCCVCKRVKAEGPAPWHKLGAEDPVPAHVSHTYCPACLRASVGAMRREFAQAETVQPLAASA